MATYKGTHDFTAATLTGTEANAASLGAIHLTRIGELRLLSNASLTVLGNESPNCVRDLFTDSNGFINTLNTGSTTAWYISAGKYYERQRSAGTPETNTWNVAASANLTSTTNVTLAGNQGYITQLIIQTLASCTSLTVNMTSGGGATTHLNKVFTVPASTNGVTIDISPGDYNSILPASTIILVVLTGTGSGININASQSYSGTNYSYTTEQIWARSSANASLTFTPYSGTTAAIVQTNAQFGSGANISKVFIGAMKEDDGTNLITYDASSNNGTNYTTGLALNTLNSITTTLGNQLIIKFNIPDNASARLYGYSLEVRR